MDNTLRYFDRVADTWPGLQCWFDFQRQPDGLLIMVFDRRVSIISPVYTLSVGLDLVDYMRNIKQGDEGRIAPAHNLEEMVAYILLREPPVGAIPAWAHEEVDSENEPTP